MQILITIASVQRFHGSHPEVVSIYAYDSVNDAKLGLEKYFRLYNHERPHTAVDDKTPDEFYFDNLLALQKAA